MGENTNIEWANHSWSPWHGCTKVSPGCDYCYADEVSEFYGFKIWGPDAPRRYLSEAYWKKPLTWNRKAQREGVRYKVFPSMCDPFERRRDAADQLQLDTLRHRTWDLIEQTPNLDWLLLTKRPQEFRHMLPKAWLVTPRPNVWGMVSVETQQYTWRIDELVKIPFAVCGISAEPLLGPLDLTRYMNDGIAGVCRDIDGGWWHEPGSCIGCRPEIQWVITGGESGSKARPSNPAWFRSLRDQCTATGVAFFHKQWGEWAPAREVAIGTPGRYAIVPESQSGLGLVEHKWAECDSYPDPQRFSYAAIMEWHGKKAAGRLLDGVEWSQVPQPQMVEV